MQPVTEQKEAEKAARQLERAEKVAHMKDVKQQVKEQAQETAANMDAYLMLSFDTWEAKAAFCERFGYDPYTKFVKGELFDEQIERIEWYCLMIKTFAESEEDKEVLAKFLTQQEDWEEHTQQAEISQEILLTISV